MTPGILDWLRSIRTKFVPTVGDVLEVGSYNVNGSPREVFQADARSYVGVDAQAGPGVDIVCDVLALRNRFLWHAFDMLICCEALEHMADPLRAVEVMRDTVRLGGMLILTTPVNGFPEHRYPRDYWRIMPDAFREIFFSGCDILDLSTTPDRILCGVARIPGGTHG